MFFIQFIVILGNILRFNRAVWWFLCKIINVYICMESEPVPKDSTLRLLNNKFLNGKSNFLLSQPKEMAKTFPIFLIHIKFSFKFNNAEILCRFQNIFRHKKSNWIYMKTKIIFKISNSVTNFHKFYQKFFLDRTFKITFHLHKFHRFIIEKINSHEVYLGRILVVKYLISNNRR